MPSTLSLKRPEHASSRQLALPGKQVSGGPWAAPIECGKGLSIPSRRLHGSMDSIVHSTRQASTSWRGVVTWPKKLGLLSCRKTHGSAAECHHARQLEISSGTVSDSATPLQK